MWQKAAAFVSDLPSSPPTEPQDVDPAASRVTLAMDLNSSASVEVRLQPAFHETASRPLDVTELVSGQLLAGHLVRPSPLVRFKDSLRTSILSALPDSAAFGVSDAFGRLCIVCSQVRRGRESHAEQLSNCETSASTPCQVGIISS